MNLRFSSSPLGRIALSTVLDIATFSALTILVVSKKRFRLQDKSSFLCGRRYTDIRQRQHHSLHRICSQRLPYLRSAWKRV
jgi:hypothetical protein